MNELYSLKIMPVSKISPLLGGSDRIGLDWIGLDCSNHMSKKTQIYHDRVQYLLKSTHTRMSDILCLNVFAGVADKY